MSSTKLTYFNATARAESIRFLLSYGELQFEDERLEREAFIARKESFPFGKVPVLEIDGMTLHQSVTICRYLGKKFGLTGKNEREALECEMIGETINDVRGFCRDYYWEPKAEIKSEKKQKTLDQVNFYLGRFDAIIAKNGGYFVGGQLTWADFLFAAQADNLSTMMGQDLYENFPNVRALRDKVYALPAIKKYMENRPKTQF